MKITRLFVFVATVITAAHAQQEYTATLVGHAALPAETLIAAPDDAPEFLKTSGKFTERGNPVRLDKQPTSGAELPFTGQPLQGFSGIKTMGDGTYQVLTDNGFGAKANSPDAMLMFHSVKPNFDTGEVAILNTTFLHDPNKIVPFLITLEATDRRYLTGADFDLESFQPVGDLIFFGDEFGPYVFAADTSGKVVEFYPTFIGEKEILSPDNYKVNTPNPDKGAELTHNLKRSRGFEGLAASTDGTMLYPMLEGPVYDADAGDYENVDGSHYLRILEFSVADRAWTGRSFNYVLEDNEHAIGDFNFIDETRALVIERDGGQGDVELVCEGDETENCFENPARFKRVYLVNFDGVEDNGIVNKVAYIDLLNMADPNGVARLGKRDDGRFRFPFVTIEDVDRVDDTHIIVANDNNFPFSKGRDLVERDNNEFILLEVAEFLNAN